MPTVGGLLSRVGVALLALSVLSISCVQDAVLDNEIARAHDKQAALGTATDLNIAEAALSAQLIELEALFQRETREFRQVGISDLLDRGYGLMEQGFIEARRLEAVAAGDTARAEQERALQADAHARSHYYRGRANHLPESAPSRLNLKTEFLSDAEAACQKHDRSGYEQKLSALLAQSPGSPHRRLELALAKRQAAAWLMPNVAARCGFEAPPTAATPAAPSPASR